MFHENQEIHLKNIIEAITTRASKRKFLNKVVPKETQEKILEAASMTPSGANMQPWVVYAISNKDVLDKIGNDIIAHIDAGNDVDQFIQYYPINWINPYKKRRITTGAGLYKHLEVDRKDEERRKELWHDNYRWFGAQTVFFICTDKSLIDGAQGALIDCGAYMQSLMLAAQAYGIDSCPQGSTTEYGRVIAKTLDLPDNLALLYSIVLGYEDTSAVQNSYQPERAPMNEIVTFID